MARGFGGRGFWRLGYRGWGYPYPFPRRFFWLPRWVAAPYPPYYAPYFGAAYPPYYGGGFAYPYYGY